MKQTQVAVQASSLHVNKRDKNILKDLNFIITSGSVTGLIGPSGSGKTTLMRTIVGVQKVTSGRLDVMHHSAGAKLLRSKIGYVTQSPAIYGDLTVAQNIKYFGAIACSSRKKMRKIIEEVHLDEYADQIVDRLSGGQRARVSLAIALLGDPELLVLDEPTVGLDPILRDELWKIFHTLADTGKTLMISSHVMDEADRCDDLLLLRKGAVIWNQSRIALLRETNTHLVGEAFLAKIKDAES